MNVTRNLSVGVKSSLYLVVGIDCNECHALNWITAQFVQQPAQIVGYLVGCSLGPTTDFFVSFFKLSHSLLFH